MSDTAKRDRKNAAVEKTARLAKLAFDEAEMKRFVEKAASVLEYVEQLSELDTSGIEPTSHAVDFRPVLRQDEVRTFDDPDSTTADAPERDGPYVQVPRVIESE
ncbi:MAG: Asp-tRNA(Asn)/Glu-tRNA(Gln) amidotransferase subunit GatC [Proteobacteria bacterium]|nr:Asp-tRNA(Asn)/Glu-tRNA(Gln) amidotransferase subunit GatC [Pseudomonadota bacterium]